MIEYLRGRNKCYTELLDILNLYSVYQQTYYFQLNSDYLDGHGSTTLLVRLSVSQKYIKTNK